MADQATSKIDAAAEKAYAEAAAKTAPAVKAEASETVVAPKVAATPPAEKVAAPKTVAAKPVEAVKAPVKKPVKKVAAKKVAAKKVVAKKTATKSAPRKTAAKAAKPTPIKAPATKISTLKETIMTKATKTTTDYTAQVKDGLADLQTRAKTVYEKGTVLASEMGEFSKHNVEAIVESGKILATGMQDMAKNYVEEGKAAVSTMTSDAKEIAAVKSPTEFVQLQSQIVSRNFDATVANVSKTTEAWVKLANEAFAPISSRASVAMDKVRKAA
jgi:phasin family protein